MELGPLGNRAGALVAACQASHKEGQKGESAVTLAPALAGMGMFWSTPISLLYWSVSIGWVLST